jgi:hypothetical protein
MTNQNYHDIMAPGKIMPKNINQDMLMTAIDSKIEKRDFRRRLGKQLGTLSIMLALGVGYIFIPMSKTSISENKMNYSDAVSTWDDVLLIDKSDDDLISPFTWLEYISEQDGEVNTELIHEYLTENEIKALTNYLEKELI